MNSASLADLVSSFPTIMPWHSSSPGATAEVVEDDGETLEAARNLEALLEQLRALFRADIVALYLIRPVRSVESDEMEPYAELEGHVGYRKAVSAYPEEPMA